MENKMGDAVPPLIPQRQKWQTVTSALFCCFQKLILVQCERPHESENVWGHWDSFKGLEPLLPPAPPPWVCRLISLSLLNFPGLTLPCFTASLVHLEFFCLLP